MEQPRDHTPALLGVSSHPEVGKGLRTQDSGTSPVPLPPPSPAQARTVGLCSPPKDVAGVRAGAHGELRDPAGPLLSPHHVHGLQQVVKARRGAECAGAVGDAVLLAGCAVQGHGDALRGFAAVLEASPARGGQPGALGPCWAGENDAAIRVVASGCSFRGQEAVALGGPGEGAGGALQHLGALGSGWRHLDVFNVCRQKEEAVNDSVLKEGSLHTSLLISLSVWAPVHHPQGVPWCCPLPAHHRAASTGGTDQHRPSWRPDEGRSLPRHPTVVSHPGAGGLQEGLRAATSARAAPPSPGAHAGACRDLPWAAGVSSSSRSVCT